MLVRATLALWLCTACASSGERQVPADLILTNGVVWTVDPEQPTAQAVAVGGGRILAVGKSKAVKRLAGKATRVIDLEGRLVLPGFIDNRVHLAAAARFIEFNIMSVGSQTEFVRRVEELASDLPPGEWILGGYWGAYDPWAPGSAGGERREPFTPDMRRVETVTVRHPMFIRKYDSSEFAVNTAALIAAGLNPADPRAEGVEFARDINGLPTGIVRGPRAEALFKAAAPKGFSRERRLAQTRRALAELRKHGVTTISDASGEQQLELYRELRDAEKLTVRVRYRYPLERWADLTEAGVRPGSGDAWIRLGCLEGSVDGLIGTSAARFFGAYSHQPGNRGRWGELMVDAAGHFVEGQLLGYMLDADRAGLQLSVHAAGDQANHVLLNYLEDLERVNGSRERRFRLVRAQVLAPDDFARLGELGVACDVQPFHLADDMRWMAERIGASRCRGAYAFKSMLERGAVVTFGSDWPGNSTSEYPIDPLLGLYAAVARRTVTGQPEQGWFPEQRLSIEQAIHAYTYAGAYASFEEHELGSIAPGKLADLVVLSKNLLEIPPERFLETEVLYTIVGGRVVYER